LHLKELVLTTSENTHTNKQINNNNMRSAHIVLAVLLIVTALLTNVHGEACVSVDSSMCYVNGKITPGDKLVSGVTDGRVGIQFLTVSTTIKNTKCLAAVKALICSKEFPTCSKDDVPRKVCKQRCTAVQKACEGTGTAYDNYECNDEDYSTALIDCTHNNSGMKTGVFTSSIVLFSILVSVVSLLQ
jgi:hypothetical protein